MRALLRRLGPRYGVSLGLVVIVVIIIVLAHTFGGHRNPGLVTGGGPAPSTSVATGPPDDGEGTVPTPAGPSTSPGAADPRTVAGKFAAAWLNHDVPAAQWHSAVAKYATAELSNELDGADPAGVPADRVSGVATQIDIGASFVQFAVPTDTGTLTLSLTADHGRWLVSGIDWTPS